MTGFLRRQWVDAVLVVVALALVVTVLVTHRTTTTDEREARSDNLLQFFDEERITRVRLERKEGSFAFVRVKPSAEGGTEWQLREPMTEDAEPFAVQKLLGTLEFATSLRSVRPELVNRASFGLDAPVLVVHVDMGDVRYRLRIGNEAPTPKGARYVEVTGENAPGKRVALVGKSLLDELQVKLDDFRERYVMPYLSTTVEAIVLEGEGGTRRLKRGELRDSFRFDGMMGDARIGRAALDRILTQFSRTRADSFLDPRQAEEAQSGKESVTITMTPRDKKNPVGVVVIGGQCPSVPDSVVALRKAPDRVAACVPGSVLRGLTAPAESLVDRALFWMRPDEVERLEISRGETQLALERKGSAFLLRAPREENVDAEVGGDRVEALVRASGAVLGSPDRKQLGLDPPSGTAVVRSAAADDSKVMEERIAIGQVREDGTLTAERLSDHAVIELTRETARALSTDASLFRNRLLLDVPIIDVAAVDVEGPVRQGLDRTTAGAFTLRTPSGFQVDSALALELCDALRELRAERWITDRDDGSFGLDAPSITARITLRKGDALETRTLRVGRPAASGYYASLEGTGGVFVIPRRLQEILTTWVIDRSVFLMDPESTRKVTLTTPERTVVLENTGGSFAQTDSTSALSQESVERIVSTLSELRAEALIDLGPPRPETGLSQPILSVTLEREPGSSPATSFTFSIGAGDTWRGVTVHYVRASTAAATYVVSRSAVRALTDAL